MGHSERDSLDRERQRRRDDEERQRREHLLHELEGLALDFRHAPEQLGYYLADHARLRPGDLDRVQEHLFSVWGPRHGEPLIARAFAAAGFIAAPDAMPAGATGIDWGAGRAPEIYDSSRSSSILASIQSDWGLAKPAPAGASSTLFTAALTPPAPGVHAASAVVGVQFKGEPGTDDVEVVEDETRKGLEGASGRLPHKDRIQKSFGAHDVGQVEAHVDAAARAAARALGVEAFTRDGRVAFRAHPDLRTAAHEAAHVVQQRAGARGKPGDQHERHADAVADKVVRGESAEGLLDRIAVPPPRPGSWADVHGRRRRQATDAMLREWREAAARADARGARRPADASERAQQEDLLALLGEAAEPLALDMRTLVLRTDAKARASLSAVGAAGLVEGDTLALTPDLAPRSWEARYLVGHELTHLAQQRSPRIGYGGVAAAEVEADEMGRGFAKGRPLRAPRESLAKTAKVASDPPKKNPEPGMPARGRYLVIALAKGTWAFKFNGDDVLEWKSVVRETVPVYMSHVFPGTPSDVVEKVASSVWQGPTLGQVRKYAQAHGFLLIEVGPVAHQQVVTWMAKNCPEVKPRRHPSGKPSSKPHARLDQKGEDTPPDKKDQQGTDDKDQEAGGKKDQKGADERDQKGTGKKDQKGTGKKDQKGTDDGQEVVSESGKDIEWEVGEGGGSQRPEQMQELLDLFNLLLAELPDHPIFQGKHPPTWLDLLYLISIKKWWDRIPPVSKKGKKGRRRRRLFIDWLATEKTAIGDVASSGTAEQGKPHRRRAPSLTPRCEAKGKIVLSPEVDKYIKGSEVGARLVFDPDSRCTAYNFNWRRNVDISWELRRGGEVVESESGRIVDIDLDDTGTYELHVVATSGLFTNPDNKLERSRALTVVEEKQREAEVFDSLFVGDQDDQKPFYRDENGNLGVKGALKPLSVGDEIKLLQVRIGMVTKAVEDRVLTPVEGAQAIALLKRQIAALEKLEPKVDGAEYTIKAVFVSREDSSSAPVSAYMKVATRSEHILQQSKRHYRCYNVKLYDTTLDPSKPTQHCGRGRAFLPPSESCMVGGAASKEHWITAERDALKKMAAHWHGHNDYPDGRIHLGIPMLESPGEVFETSFDTDNASKTASAILRGIATAAGVLAMVAAPFAGGTTVGVGLVLLRVGAAVAAAATIADVVVALQDRYEKEGELKIDGRFWLDMLDVVTAVVGVAGGLRSAFRGSRVGKGLYIAATAGIDVASFMLFSGQLKQQMLALEGSYALKIQAAKTDEERNQLRRERDSQLAALMGYAALGRGFMLVSVAGAFHQARGLFSGKLYKVRPEIRDLAEGADPNAIRKSLKKDPLSLEERFFLEDALAAGSPDYRVLKHIGDHAGDFDRQTKQWLRKLDDRALKALAEIDLQPAQHVAAIAADHADALSKLLKSHGANLVEAFERAGGKALRMRMVIGESLRLGRPPRGKLGKLIAEMASASGKRLGDLIEELWARQVRKVKVASKDALKLVPGKVENGTTHFDIVVEVPLKKGAKPTRIDAGDMKMADDAQGGSMEMTINVKNRTAELPDGTRERVTLEKTGDFSWTQAAVDKANEWFRGKHGGREIRTMKGVLMGSNWNAFIAAYKKLRKEMPNNLNEARKKAVEGTPYGRARVAAGYDEFDFPGWKDVQKNPDPPSQGALEVEAKKGRP